MSVDLKQFDGSIVTPSDDANLYHLLYGRSGIVTGIHATHAGTNQVSISAGWGVVFGRVFTVAAQTLGVTLVGGAYGRLKIVVDLSNISTPAYFESEAASSLPALTQEDLSASGDVYEVPICTYAVGAIAISNLVDARPIVTFNSAANMLLTGYTKPASSSALSSSDTINAALGKLEAGDAFLLQWGKLPTNDDLDDCVTGGIYYFSQTTDNTPYDGFGICEVIISNGITYNGISNWMIHRVTKIDTTPNSQQLIYQRLKINDTAFTPWKLIVGTNYIDVSSSRDFALNDAGNTLIVNTAVGETTVILTVRADADINFPIGTRIRVLKADSQDTVLIQQSTGVSFSGVTGTSGIPLVNYNGSIEKIGANLWVVNRHA